MHLSLNFELLMVKNHVFTKIVIMAVKCSSYKHSRLRQNLQIFISGFIVFDPCPKAQGRHEIHAPVMF